MPHSRSNADLREHNRTNAPVVGSANFAVSQTQSAIPTQTSIEIPKTSDKSIGERVDEKKEKFSKLVSLVSGGS